MNLLKIHMDMSSVSVMMRAGNEYLLSIAILISLIGWWICLEYTEMMAAIR